MTNNIFTIVTTDDRNNSETMIREYRSAIYAAALAFDYVAKNNYQGDVTLRLVGASASDHFINVELVPDDERLLVSLTELDCSNPRSLLFELPAFALDHLPSSVDEVRNLYQSPLLLCIALASFTGVQNWSPNTVLDWIHHPVVPLENDVDDYNYEQACLLSESLQDVDWSIFSLDLDEDTDEDDNASPEQPQAAREPKAEFTLGKTVKSFAELADLLG